MPDGRVRLSRRTLTRATVWTAPVVAAATAAPAYAASGCSTTSTYALAWPTGYTRASATSGSASVTNGIGTPVTMTLATVAVGATALDATRNLQVPANTGTATTLDPVVVNLGARTGERGIRLHHATSTAGRDNRQELTLTFSRPVTGLTFWITDIDTLASPAYSDRVELVGYNTNNQVVARNQLLDGITGSGTTADPWLRAASGNIDENAAGAQVQVTYPGAVSRLVLTYWNATGGTQYHRIFLGRMNFTAFGC